MKRHDTKLKSYDFSGLNNSYLYQGILAILKYCERNFLECDSIYTMVSTRHIRAVTHEIKTCNHKVFRLWYNPERGYVYNTTKEDEANQKRLAKKYNLTT